MIATETAKVYRANGRRFFTKKAAYRALAKQKINERCECECAEPGYTHGSGYPGMTCWYHKDQDRYQRMVRTLSRIYFLRDKPHAQP